MKTINSFVRPSTFSFLLRGEKVLLGEVQEGAMAGDLKVAGDVKEGFLRVSRYDGAHWRNAGGYWSGQLYKMTSRHAQHVSMAMRALGVDDYFIAAAALLATDAESRYREQMARELQAKEKLQC
jgi:hypothetical protein